MLRLDDRLKQAIGAHAGMCLEPEDAERVARCLVVLKKIAKDSRDQASKGLAEVALRRTGFLS